MVLSGNLAKLWTHLGKLCAWFYCSEDFCSMCIYSMGIYFSGCICCAEDLCDIMLVPGPSAAFSYIIKWGIEKFLELFLHFETFWKSSQWCLHGHCYLTLLDKQFLKFNQYLMYKESHYGDKTVVRSSYLHNGISYFESYLLFVVYHLQVYLIFCSKIIWPVSLARVLILNYIISPFILA